MGEVSLSVWTSLFLNLNIDRQIKLFQECICWKQLSYLSVTSGPDRTVRTARTLEFYIVYWPLWL